MLLGAVTLQAWRFQALQQIACEKCGLVLSNAQPAKLSLLVGPFFM
jgi:hypothetical protein